MKFHGRTVQLAPTEPIPDSMRLSPGYLMVTAAEFRALEREEQLTQLALLTVIHDLERAELADKLQVKGKRK